MSQAVRVLMIDNPNSGQFVYLRDVIHQEYTRWLVIKVTSKKELHQALCAHDYHAVIIHSKLEWMPLESLVTEIRETCVLCYTVLHITLEQLSDIDLRVFELIDECLCALNMAAQDRALFKVLCNRLDARAIFDDEKNIFHQHDTHRSSRRIELENIRRHEEQLHLIGQLAGAIAHDFNNVLALIKGYSQLGKAAGDNVGLMEQSLQKILDASNRGIVLVNQIMSFSRRTQEQIQEVDLNEMICQMRDSLESLMGDDIEVMLSLDPHISVIKIMPESLEQILMNLITNARNAMRDGGCLSISTRYMSVDSIKQAPWNHENASTNYICIAITDTGSGIDPELQQRIFEPFFTTRVLGVGTGLGLASVLKNVRKNRGLIRVESQVGQGTTFYVALPINGGLHQSLSAERGN